MKRFAAAKPMLVMLVVFTAVFAFKEDTPLTSPLKMAAFHLASEAPVPAGRLQIGDVKVRYARD